MNVTDKEYKNCLKAIKSLCSGTSIEAEDILNSALLTMIECKIAFSEFECLRLSKKLFFGVKDIVNRKIINYSPKNYTEKFCRGCSEAVPVQGFYLIYSTKNPNIAQYSHLCKKCDNKRRKDQNRESRRKDDKKRLAYNRWMKNYRMLKAQEFERSVASKDKSGD